MVDVVPPQAEQFALAHPGRDGEDVEGVHRVIARGIEERGDGFAIEHAHFPPLDARRRDAVTWVAGEQSPPHRLGERAVEDDVRVPDAAAGEAGGRELGIEGSEGRAASSG